MGTGDDISRPNLSLSGRARSLESATSGGTRWPPGLRCSTSSGEANSVMKLANFSSLRDARVLVLGTPVLDAPRIDDPENIRLPCRLTMQSPFHLTLHQSSAAHAQFVADSLRNGLRQD